MPGQLASLNKRIDLLVPEREQRLQQLEAATDEAAALSAEGTDDKGAERALKRAARLRVEVKTVTGELDTLRSMVAARLAQAQKPRW